MHRRPAVRNLLALIGFYIPVLCVQTYGAMLTQTSVHGWYAALEKSALTPPGYVFGIVWTALYILMTVAAWRIWRIERRIDTPAQRMWLLQLVGGLLWTMVFFGMRLPQEGLATIACVWIFATVALCRFARIDRPAAALLAPLVLWVSFALYLNLYIAQHN